MVLVHTHSSHAPSLLMERGSSGLLWGPPGVGATAHSGPDTRPWCRSRAHRRERPMTNSGPFLGPPASSPTSRCRCVAQAPGTPQPAEPPEPRHPGPVSLAAALTCCLLACRIMVSPKRGPSPRRVRSYEWVEAALRESCLGPDGTVRRGLSSEQDRRPCSSTGRDRKR